MAIPGRAAVPVLLAMLLFFAATGCGGGADTEEDAWRSEVNGSVTALENTSSLRYVMHLETWIGVSGQSVYGDEKSEGAYLDGDFSASITRTSPAGEESLVFTSFAGAPYLKEGNAWSVISSQEAPSPLYDPETLTVLLSSYESISLQGEEERSGAPCRRYLLRLDGGPAREAIPERAWSYFSNLHFELNCTVWVSDASMPPAALQLEIIGLDPLESLQRYRVLASLDLSGFDSTDIELTLPVE